MRAKTKANTYPLQVLVFVTLLLSPAAHGARTPPQLPDTPPVSEGTWPKKSTFSALDPDYQKEAVARVKSIDNGPPGKLASHVDEARASHERSRPPVFKHPVPTMGQTSYCIKHVKKRIEDLQLQIDNQLIDSVCSMWGDTVAEYYDFMDWWKGVVASTDEVENSFGSIDDLVSMMVDAIWVARMDISSFTVIEDMRRQQWADDMNAAIDNFEGGHDIKNAATIVTAAATIFVPVLFEAAMILPAAVDLLGQVGGGLYLGYINKAFDGGINTLYLSEEGKKIKSMMDFLQTIHGMNQFGGRRWEYIGQVLREYVKSASASNRTYTAADVRRDLAKLDMTGTEMDDYIENIFHATFNQPEFLRELVPTFLIDGVSIVTDMILVLYGTMELNNIVREHIETLDVLERYKRLSERHEVSIRTLYADRSLRTKVKQREDFIQKYTKWKKSGEGEKPTITKELWEDFQEKDLYLAEMFEEKSDIINTNIQAEDIGAEGSSVPKEKITHYEIKDLDKLGTRRYYVTSKTIGLDGMNRQLVARRDAAVQYRKFYTRLEDYRILGRGFALLTAGLALDDYEVTKSLVSNLRHRVEEMVDQDYLAMEELTNILDTW